MNTILIAIPASVLLSTGQSEEEFVREAKFPLALKLFELGRLSASKAAEVCGQNRVDFLLLARAAMGNDVPQEGRWRLAASVSRH